MFTSEQLNRELTREEFEEQYLTHLRAWMAQGPRPLGSWLLSVQMWAQGDH